ncbi:MULTISPECIES: nucleotidyltransferase family protein [Pseudomonas syringae group]|uniref:Molybdopterin-guanine dinucleotide biosynthesis protein A n=1 Tax=Pseudomonas syringae pv. ribicola TaxID=55398 RepID=A0A3M2W4J2_PSESI|nr:nucleotidyltransferase family protein [Pseudomonas syringae group genomosp. 3]RML46293.1 Molybdopterin-guanine dinucleotide biosynthesis protein A [Pseudomonas syringae pv. ribicola]
MSSIDSQIPKVFALVLAAGRSRRFDGDKRKALLPCGRTLLTASLETAGKVFTQTGVVLREDDEVQTLGIPSKVTIIRSEHADLGMGHSLAAGITAALNSSADAVAILLADMPWIEPQTLRDLARLANTQRIALPMHEGQRGHPVIIGRRFWPELLTLEGDQGAKALIINNPALCDVMNCDDPGVLRDADTRSALAIACRQHLIAGRD